MTLLESIEDYLKNRAVHLQKTKVYYQSIAFDQALDKASFGYTNQEKVNSHQRRIGRLKCEIGKIYLQQKVVEINNCKTFEAIFDIVNKISLSKEARGLGALWAYDTALRIGFNKNLFPEYIYIQAGVKKGIKKYFNLKKPGQPKPNDRCLDKSVFSEEFNTLEPYQIENFLCIWGGKGNRKVRSC